MMKRFFAAALALMMLFALAACAGAEGDSHILVAYFSATNHTEAVARQLAEGLGADIYEIAPEVPYTERDVTSYDSDTRPSLEHSDPAARPAIAGEPIDLSGYDVIFLGYPIWWGEAPRILSTFVESYDLSGKTVAPFCTSDSSPFGESDAALREAAPGANWLEGARFPAGAAGEEVLAWVEGLGLDGIAGSTAN